ncbi:VOC family protein [Pseudalkalibacillus hwajinpoensis]|uniref:VOC family protein n=1 Tax=Guptibacillus hwajinpoensis TaxID=208199 RepID=UPI001CD566F1|nr:VOC family protein [Pseudalkalibacillus hwajinpoensis]MCA0990436.1 VOC family protein [Pseudalkalibacillus hwajinpoensis]
MLNNVCVITIKVSNMKESLAFYTEILDFKISKEYGPNIVSLQHESIPIVLEEEFQETVKNSVLIAIQSDNIHQDFQWFKDKEVSILSEEPEPCPPGLFFVIEDPSGNRIEILQFMN